MKTKQLFTPLACTLAFIVSCEEKEKKYEDSPLITVNSPLRNQVINDADTVRVQAVIENKEASPIKSVSVWLLDNEKKYIYHKEWPCDCKGEKLVTIQTKFLYDIHKSSDLVLHLDATLENGTSLREEIPFRLLDTK